MLNTDKQTNQKLIAIHGWSGISLGLLLYAVIITGTIAVFADEIGQWSIGVNPPSPFEERLSDSSQAYKPLQSIIDDLSESVDPRYLDEITVFPSVSGQLDLFFHTHEKNEKGQLEDVGTLYRVNPINGEILSQRDGTGADIFNKDSERALSRFLVNIHTELHIPSPWGLFLTGVLGLAMMVAAISGFIIHRQLFKHIFTFRRDKNEQVKARDAHTLAGTWSLPFAFVLALTGCFFSFAGSVGIPLLAMVGFGGNQEKMIETIIGVSPKENKTPVDPASIDAMITDSYQRAQAAPTFIVIQHTGRADSVVSIAVAPEEGELSGDTFIYSGASGEFERVKPVVGAEPSLGSTLFDLIGPLHFGNFLGFISKAIWFSLGIAMTYVTLTGMRLWLHKRRSQTSLAWLERLVITIGHGLPLAMLGCAYGYFMSNTFDEAAFWTPVSFLIISAIAIGYGVVEKNVWRMHNILNLCIGLGCLLLPLFRIIIGGPGWLTLLSNNALTVISVDLLLLAAGIVTLMFVKRSKETAQAELIIQTIPSFK